jgi:hypothetical protein
LFGGAVLALGGAGLALQPTRRTAEPTAPLRVLDARGFQVMAAIAARVVTVEGADPAAIAQGADDALSRAAPEAQADLRKVLVLFENALPGLLFDGRARPFTQLDAAAQDRVLEAWRESRLVIRRGAYQALRKLCLAVHYGEPRTWRDLRYPGPPQLGGLFYDDSKAGAVDVPAAPPHDSPVQPAKATP